MSFRDASTDRDVAQKPPSPPPHPHLSLEPALLVRNLDSGEARPIAAGTEWTEEHPSGEGERPLAPRQTSAIPQRYPSGPGRPSQEDSGMAARARSDVAERGARLSDSLPPRPSRPSVTRAPLPSTPTKVTAHRKARHDFRNLRRYQCFDAHVGPIRALAISPSGKYLASAGADCVVNVFELSSQSFENSEVPRSPTLDAHIRARDPGIEHVLQTGHGVRRPAQQDSMFIGSGRSGAVNQSRACAPLVSCKGHTQDVVDLSWSKNDFLLSASLDNTMCLWHPSSDACLRRFLHSDMVTSVTFHPEDGKIGVSGTADGTLRLWHLRERKLLSETHTGEVITATTINPSGLTLLAGTVMGRCKFYDLFDEIQGEWQLVHTTQMDVRSARGRNKKAAKISGIAFSAHDSNEFIVSSNDSRIRLYRMDDKSVVYKYAGHVCNESQLKASFSPCGRFILSGSENKQVFLWEIDDQPGTVLPAKGKADDSSQPTKKDRNLSYESFVPHEHSPLSAAVFAPTFFYPRRGDKDPAPNSSRSSGLTIVTASMKGEICVFACL